MIRHRSPSVTIVLALLLCMMIAVAPSAGYAAPPIASGQQDNDSALAVVAILPLAGGAQFLGAAAQEGIDLAVLERNAAGGLLGRQVTVQYLDSACSAAGGANAATQAINTYHTNYIIGDVCSGPSIAIAQLANAAQVLQITPTATNPAVTVDSYGATRQYVYRACFTDEVQGRGGARFAWVNLGAKKAYLLHDPGNDYSTGLYSRFKSTFTWLGGNIAGDTTYSGSTPEFSSIITTIIAAAPDVIYLPDYYNVANLFAAQARARGVMAPIIGPDGWDSPDLNYTSVEPGYFTNHFSPDDPATGVQAFVQSFTARYGHAPNSIAALSYEAASLLFQGIQAAGVDDPTAVSASLAQRELQELMGPLRFDSQHNPQKSMVMMSVSGGGSHFLAEVPYWLPLQFKTYLPAVRR